MEMTPEVWKEIDDNWGFLRELFIERLPVHENKAYDDNGRLVDTERPMLESIQCDWKDRNRRFFYYLMAADHDCQVEVKPNGGRVIHLGVHSSVGLGYGGGHSKHVK